MIKIKKDVVIDGKDKKMICVYTISKTMSNFVSSDNNSEPKPLNLISFSLLIDQDVLSNLNQQF